MGSCIEKVWKYPENWENLEVSQAQLNPRTKMMLSGLSYSPSLISAFFGVVFVLRWALSL